MCVVVAASLTGFRLRDVDHPSFLILSPQLKANKPIDAINVGMQVLKEFPNYPKIQEEVIQRAMAMVRL